MLITITHETTYTYDDGVPFALQEIRLTPRTNASQDIRRWNVEIEGGTREVDFVDHHANHVQLISIFPDHDRITVRCEGEVETVDRGGVLPASPGFAPLWLFLRATQVTTAGSRVTALVDDLLRGDQVGTVDQVHELSRRVADAVVYELGHTHTSSTAEDVLAAGRGVCQDHAHVFIASARKLGLPARYVSGYLVMTDRVDQDATHAWAEVWINDLGWVGFDVSNGICPDDRYVRVAVGLDYREAAPISGVRFGDAAEEMQVSLQVQQ